MARGAFGPQPPPARDSEHPVEVAFFDTVPYDDDVTAFGGSWSNYPFFPSGVIAVSSWNEGLFILAPLLLRSYSFLEFQGVRCFSPHGSKSADPRRPPVAPG